MQLDYARKTIRVLFSDIPPSVLRSPIFDVELPNALNFGLMGFILGHEFGHSLTMLATVFDKSRALEDAWPTATKAKFDDRARCVSQAFKDEVKTASDHELLQTKLWLEEAVADSGKSYFRSTKQFLFLPLAFSWFARCFRRSTRHTARSTKEADANDDKANRL